MPDQHPSRRSSGHSSGGSGSGSGSGSGRGPSKKRLQARRRNSARAIHATGRLLEAISQDRSESASRPSSSASLGPALSVRPQPLPSWNRGARVSRSDRRDAPQDAEERRKTERRGRRRQGKERQEEDRNLAEHLSGLRQLVLTDAYKILAPTLLPIIDDERLTAAYRISSTKKAIRDLAMGAETSAPEEAQPEPVPEPEPVSEPEPEPMSQGDYGFLVPDEEDCQGRGHVFRGVTQPPVGIRLQQILSYLSGEDVYSDADWRERVDDIGAYLDFLEDRPTRQAPEAGLLATPESAPAVRGRQTKLMLAEARRRLRAHRVFNDYHEGVVSGRVELLQSRRAIPVPSGRRVQVSHVLQDRPFPVGEIRATTEGDDGANVGGSMGEHYPEAERYRAQLARDDERLLLETVLPGESPPRRPYRRPEEGPNLANEENTEFHADLAAHRGWVDTAPEGEAGGSGGGGRVRRLLPDGTTLEGDAISYARERGARRAGLQLALSQFGSPEEEGGNDMPQRDVVLPLSASDVQDEVDRVTGLWPREASGDNGGGGRWIQPYTFYMAQYREWRAEQRRADAGDGDNDRRMLQLLRETTRQLERSGAIAPRQLLSDVHEYMEQGFRGGSVPPSELVMRNAFDWAPADSPGGQRRVRRVNETEVHWLRFLLTDSTNPALARPLESEPDAGRATLYRCFARRLQALLDDRSDDRLFATAETRVPVAAVAAAINASAGAARDARQKMRFSLEDASFFCDRLSRAGRCCFWHDPFDDGHGGGHVQRPVLTVHPEHRIFDGNELAWGEPSWLRQQPVPSGGEDNNDSDSDGDDDDDDDDDDDAVGAPRRSTEVDASWEQTLESGRPDRRLRAGVRDFFCTLAFRFGVTLREMEAEEAARSGGRTSFQQALLLTWRQTQAANPDELVDVVRQADPEAYRDDMTAEEARSRIRRHLIAESESPNRPGQAGRPDHLWDWADAAIVGTAPQFFNMDRWPLALQTRATQTATKKRKWPFDPEMAWDPASEDPTPVRFRRVRPRPIGFSKRVVRHGPAAFELGDTALQRQAVIEDLTARVARSIGGAWALPRQSRWRRWMGAIPVPFVGRVLADGHDSSDFSDMIVETTGLPRVAAKAIPSSGQLV